MKRVGTTGRASHSIQAWARGVLCIVALALIPVVTLAGQAATPVVHPQANATLLKAAQEFSLTSLRGAIGEGADVNCRDADGLTPLLKVLSQPAGSGTPGRGDCLALLLKSGAQVNAKDGQGRTPLIYAVRAGDLASVKLLVEAGAGITLRDGSHKTALLHAAECGQREILIYLGQSLKAQQRQSAW